MSMLTIPVDDFAPLGTLPWWYTLASPVCSLVLVALFAPRRFWAPSSGKRLGRRRYAAESGPDFC